MKMTLSLLCCSLLCDNPLLLFTKSCSVQSYAFQDKNWLCMTAVLSCVKSRKLISKNICADSGIPVSKATMLDWLCVFVRMRCSGFLIEFGKCSRCSLFFSEVQCWLTFVNYGGMLVSVADLLLCCYCWYTSHVRSGYVLASRRSNISTFLRYVLQLLSLAG